MMTLRQFSESVTNVPAAAAWALADLGEFIGRQQLFIRHSPQKLKVLREHALIESAVSSNRIEGVEVDQKRIGTLMFGRPTLRDRDEEEVRGYRDALNLIHTRRAKLSISVQTILDLHKVIRGETWDAGKLKDKDADIIEKYPDGRWRVRFTPVSAKATPKMAADLVEAWRHCLRERWVHPLVAMAAFNLDFLCIHPFRDGNGRTSRLLLLLQCYHQGIEVGRYISLERIIEQNKERYYETLERSSRGWHQGKHDPWPFINHVLFILKEAYREFEQRLGRVGEPKGAKTELLLSTIARMTEPFSVADLQRECPGVGVDLIRRVLKRERLAKKVVCLGKGRSALWQRRTARKK